MAQAPKVEGTSSGQSLLTDGLGILEAEMIGTTPPMYLRNDGTFRTESTVPVMYRLMKKKDGTTVLQGAYQFWGGDGCCGHEWREIPTEWEE